MKKNFYLLAALSPVLALPVVADEANDSLRLRNLNEAVVKSVKAPKDAPFAVTNISKKQMQDFSAAAQELPYLFARTPGVMAWSENGLSTGTSYMRIRGAADSRINVTIDGVALNSPEDQCVFWANMNSYAALLGGAQIQRGVGSSTNGDGAFGGTLVLQTAAPSEKAMLDITGNLGSYDTWRAGAKFSTGMLWNHLIFDGALHHTGTQGYVHGTDGNSGSYYGGLTFYNTSRTLKLSYKNIGNYEHTGQAWNGVTAGTDNYSINTYDGVKTYAALYKLGYGRYNSLFEHYNEYTDADWNYHLTQGEDGKYTTERYKMSDGTLWPRTTDNFWQNHSLLNLSWRISERWHTTGTAHYTRGAGYYDEFRYNNKLGKFGFSTFKDAEGNKVKRTDFVRQKGLTQDHFGLLWNANYKDSHWDVIFGASFQGFLGNHYGYLTYIKHPELAANYMADGKYQYYDSDAQKWDAQAFAKATYHITKHWDVFGDVQYRYVNYKTNGNNDKFVENEDGTFTQHLLDINKQYHFVNPKVGFAYTCGGHRAYASYALGNREPERNNFTDNGHYAAPEPEMVHDVEAGYTFTNRYWNLGANLYYMRYHNQFVKTGQKSDIGEDLTTNIKDSYRMGVELSAAYSPVKWFTVEANAALSQNKVLDFDEAVETYDNYWENKSYPTVHYDNSTLAFSPSVLLNGFLDFHYAGFQGVWHTNFVSRQYLDNTQNQDRSLPAFTTSNVHLTYDLELGKRGLKHIIFGAHFNNIFNAHYATSGWVYSAVVGDKYPGDNRYYQIGYIPAAGFNFMSSVTFRF